LLHGTAKYLKSR